MQTFPYRKDEKRVLKLVFALKIMILPAILAQTLAILPQTLKHRAMELDKEPQAILKSKSHNQTLVHNPVDNNLPRTSKQRVMELRKTKGHT